MDKRILFILFVLVGSTAVAISINYSVGAAHITEYVALFTSVSTAVYAVLAQPKERIEPFLRITPTIERHDGIVVGNVGSERIMSLNIWIENIGYSIAKDIEVQCRLVPNGSISLENNGVFKHSLLAPKEIVQYQAVQIASTDKLLSRQLIIEASYLNEDDEKQKPTKNVYSVKELHEGLKEVKTS
jgi:hypothetical protein